MIHNEYIIYNDEYIIYIMSILYIMSIRERERERERQRERERSKIPRGGRGHGKEQAEEKIEKQRDGAG